MAPDERRRLPRSIWVLGFVSMLADVASEMVHSLLPMFLVTSLGASVLAVGVIEGIAESTALVTKVFSGALSDYLGRRKGLAVFGYALGAVTKPAFAMATTVGVVVMARFADRIGKGIRGAPRDALVADIAPEELRGAAFGLRQSLDTVGAFIGPLLATGLMLLFASDFRVVFWFAVVPGFLAVALLLYGVQEPERKSPSAGRNPISRQALRRLGRDCWWVVALGGVFMLARFSEAFLVLLAQLRGVPMALVPLLMVAMSIVYSLSAYPFGKLADRMSHITLLRLGLVVLVGSDIVMAFATHWSAVVVGVCLWGLHMGMTQGLLAAMVADAAPADLRGTAYGFFNLVSGIALLVASAIAGLLWEMLGASATFFSGAAFAVAAFAIIALRPRFVDRGARKPAR
jgi:MFS family permease